MSTKSANLVVRMDPTIKEEGDAILEQLGLTSSAGVNMFYRQLIQNKGLPFDACIERNLPTEENLSDEEFDAMMKKSFATFDGTNGISVEDAFAEARRTYERM